MIKSKGDNGRIMLITSFILITAFTGPGDGHVQKIGAQLDEWAL